MNDEEYEERFETQLMIQVLIDRIELECGDNKVMWNPVREALLAYLDYIEELLDGDGKW